MKIIELLNAQPVIQALMDRKMPSKLAYSLAKNFRFTYTGMFRIAINGTQRWIPYYA